MKRWPPRISAAAATALFAMLAGIGPAGAEPGVAAQLGSDPPTTGRALIGVRTPSLPLLRGADSRARYQAALARSRDLLERVASRERIEVEGRSAAGGFITTDLGRQGIRSLRAKLAADPLVESVEPEYRAELRYAPNDPFVYAPDPHAPESDLAGWNILLTGAETAWNLARGAGGEVAVIDSGVYTGHPELAGRITGSLNTCTTSPLIGGCQGTGVTDDAGHGTHVAGLACAAADNGIAIASIGFGCSVYAVKSDLTYTSIVNAVYAAVAHGSDAINMSFGGGGPSTQLRDALDYAWANGTVPVAAADNAATPPVSSNYPAQYVQPEGSGPNVDAGIGLVVTSASHGGARSAWAQKTNGVSVAAYGSATDLISGGQQGILSTFPPPTVSFDSYGARTTVEGDDRYAYLVGTSMAAPQVAGLVALIRSVKPGVSAARLVKLVKQTASGCGTYGNGLGWGIIRSDRAVAAVAQKDIFPPNSRVRSAKIRHRRGHPRVVVLRLKSFDTASAEACTKEIPTSGLKAVDVFASANGGPYHRIDKTNDEKLVFGAKPRRRYRFYSIAVDRAGNRESVPEIADAKARLKKKRR